MVEGARCFGLYVTSHDVFEVLGLDLVVVLIFLGLLRDLEGWLAVEFDVVGRCVEVMREDEVLELLEGALANQFVLFVLLALELLQLS